MKYVIINDIHFSIPNLEKASFSLTSALEYCVKYKLPLIIAGDLNDSKAIIRGEVANRLLEIFEKYHKLVKIYVLIGNHDLLNEKVNDKHSLNFLKPFVILLERNGSVNGKLHYIAYQNSPDAFLKAIREVPHGDVVVCHQGFQGAFMGEYVQDKSSVDPKLVKNWHVISGHYHRRQTLDTVRYLGNPFTINFAEASDPIKGFNVWDMRSCSLAHVPVDLPRHVVFELEATNSKAKFYYNPKDYIMLRVYGTKAELAAIKRDKLIQRLFPDAQSAIKIDLIPNETVEAAKVIDTSDPSKVLTDLINGSEETAPRKKELVALAKDLLS